MAQKELGYVELEWTCPTCQARNPGTQTTCSGCGAPQPKDVQFETPAKAEITQDQAKIQEAKTGPDIHCAFCGARNPASAKICHQCGADLVQGKARAAGQVVGAYDPKAPSEIACASCGMTNPATAKACVRCGAPLGQPAPAAAPAPAQATAGSGTKKLVFIAVAGLFVVALCALVFFLFRTSNTVATVQDERWVRTIAVEGQVPVQDTAWRDELPGGVTNVSCRPEVRYTTDKPQPGAREVCGTPYTVDTGTGMGRVVQDCEYQVYDDRCTYTTSRWGVVDSVSLQGAGFAPQWPAVNLVGNQRMGARSERYECILSDGEKQYSFTLPSFEEYQACKEGTKWKLEVNTLGAVVAAEPAQ